MKISRCFSAIAGLLAFLCAALAWNPPQAFAQLTSIEGLEFQADYLMWWIQGNPVPPLVTTSPPGTPRAGAGVLGFPGTRVLAGDERIDDGLRHGVRLTAQLWDTARSSSIGGSYFYVGSDNGNDFAAASPGSPTLARPFFDVNLPGQNAQLVSFVDPTTGPLLAGQVSLATSSEIHSAKAFYRSNLHDGTRGRLDWVGGYRYLRFSESLTIAENLVSTSNTGLITQGTTIDVFDHFAVSNDFHGAELGVIGEWFFDRLAVNCSATLGIGGVHQALKINGGTVVNTPPPLPTQAVSLGGLLAQTTNIGSSSRNEFALLPELNLNVRYGVLDRLELVVGYTLLYLTEALRSGDQIDLAVNPTRIPQNLRPLVGPPRPARMFNDTSVWAQGLNLSIIVRN